MPWLTFSALVAAISDLTIGIFVFFKARRESIRLHFALMALSLAVWATSDFTTYWFALDDIQATFWVRVSYVGALFLPSSFLGFALALTNEKKQWLIRFNYALSLFLLSTVFTPLLVEHVVRTPFKEIPGFLYNVYVLQVLSSFLYGAASLFRALRHVPPTRRNQIRYALAATMSGLAGLGIYFLVTYRWDLPPIHYLLEIIVVFTLGWAIVRHQLLDIQVAITRTAIFTAVYILVLGLPLIVAVTRRFTLRVYFGENWWITLWVGSSVLATAAHYVNQYLQKKAEDRLFAEERKYHELLRQTAQEMPFVKGLDELVEKTLTALTQTLTASSASFYTRDSGGRGYSLKGKNGEAALQLEDRLPVENSAIARMSQSHAPRLIEDLLNRNPSEAERWKQCGIELVVPCWTRDKMAGFLILGSKKSGKIYAADDLEVLSVISTQLGFALENLSYIESIHKTQEQLRNSDRLATAGRLASAVAHEVKQPLTAIKTFVEELSIRGDDPAFRQQFNSVVGKELERVELTARQLMDFARPRDLVRERVQLEDVIKETSMLLGPECSKRGVVLECEISGSVALEADRRQLGQMLLNLAFNGMDAMEDASWILSRKRRLSIHASLEDGKAKLVVADNGRGMHVQEIEHLFEPFYTTKGEGTGLGLVVVQQIVEAHGGTMQVQSAYGEGTVFTIVFPAAGGSAQ